jgi:DNA-binding HxlR family transcriptional regulator
VRPPWNEDAIKPFVTLLSRRWVLGIVRELWAGSMRRVHLQDNLPGVSHKSLTETLRDLERAGLVHRTQFDEIPPRVEYGLTELGYSMGKLLAAITESVGDRLTMLVRELHAPSGRADLTQSNDPSDGDSRTEN